MRTKKHNKQDKGTFNQSHLKLSWKDRRRNAHVTRTREYQRLTSCQHTNHTINQQSKQNPRKESQKEGEKGKGKGKGKAQEQLLNKMGHGENTRGREEEGEHEQASEAMSQRHVEGTGGGEGTATIEEEYHQCTRKPNERVKEGANKKHDKQDKGNIQPVTSKALMERQKAQCSCHKDRREPKTYVLSTHNHTINQQSKQNPRKESQKEGEKGKGKGKGKAQEQLLNKMGHGENTRGREEEGDMSKHQRQCHRGMWRGPEEGKGQRQLKRNITKTHVNK